MPKYLIYILLLLILQACSPSYDSRLLKAESLMGCHPDSALSIVRAIDRNKLPNNASRALHALLLTQAETKNHIFETNDSLISTAVDYYSQTDDSHRLMLSNYYIAQVLYNKGDHPKSLVFALKAHNQAKELDQPFWIAMSARMIADIYHENYHTVEQIKFAEIEVDNFKQTKQQPYINYALLDLAQAYLNDKQYNRTIEISKQLIDSAIKYNRPNLNASATRLIGLTYIHIKDFSSALPYFENVTKQNHQIYSDSIYLIYTQLMTNSISKPNIKLPSGEKSLDNWLLYEIYSASDSTEQTIKALKNLDIYTDSILRAVMTQNLSGSMLEYYDFEKQLNKAKLQSTKILLSSSIIIIIIIIAISLILMIKYHRKQKDIIENNIQLAQNLREVMFENKTKSDSIHKLLTDRFDVIDNLCKTLYETNNTQSSRKRISDEVNAVIENLSTNSAKINELEELVNKHHNGLLYKLRNDFPNLKEQDYMLVLYSILGFSNTAISLFLKEEKITSVYARRKRLKAKFKNFDGFNSNYYIEAIS